MMERRIMRDSPQGLLPSDGALLLEFEEMVDALLQEASVTDQSPPSPLEESRSSLGNLTSSKDGLFVNGVMRTPSGNAMKKGGDEEGEEAIKRLTRELDEKMERVQYLEQGLKNMEMEIVNLQRALQEGAGSMEMERDSEVKRLMQAFSSRERQVSKLAKTVKESKARVSRLRGVVNGLEEREEKVKKELAAINQAIPKLERGLIDVAKDTSEVEKAHEMKVVELKQRLEKTEKRGKARVERVAKTLGGLKKQMEDLEGEVKVRRQNATALDAQVEAKGEVEEKAKGIRAVWEKLEEENKRLIGDINQAEQRLIRLQPDMLRQLTIEAEQRIVAARQEQLELEYQIESLHDNRFDDVQEVMYLRWINTCMRHELTIHKWRPGDPEVVVQRDSEGDGSPSSVDVYLDDHGVNSLIIEEDVDDRGKQRMEAAAGRDGRHLEGERAEGRSSGKQREGGRRQRGLLQEVTDRSGVQEEKVPSGDTSPEARDRVEAGVDSSSRETGSSHGVVKRPLDKNEQSAKTGNGASTVGSVGSVSKDKKDRKTRPVVKRLKILPRGQDVEEDKLGKHPSDTASGKRADGKTEDTTDDRQKPRKLRPPPKPSGGQVVVDRPPDGLVGLGPGSATPPLPPPLPPPRPPSKPHSSSEAASGAGSALLPIPPPPPAAGSNGIKRGLGNSHGHGMKDGVIQRAPEVVRLYQLLMKRGANRDAATTPIQKAMMQKGNSRGQLIEEMESRSTYLMAIKEDVETQAEFVNKLMEEVQNAQYAVIEDILLFVEWLDSELSYLVDERAVLKHFQWPEVKVDAFREAAFGFRDLQRVEKDVLNFDVNESLSCDAACKRIQSMLEKVESMVYGLLRARDMLIRRFQEFSIPTYWLLDTGMIGKVKRATLSLARIYMRRVSDELQDFEDDIQDDPARQLLILEAVRFAFRVHQFAGGFDSESMEVFEELRAHAHMSSQQGGR